ncbi:hypothetical protein HHK36_001255 [Tetracentron sinense]|uniref:Uncharacterized protein n=1 Tax=Tetracentron sinense TaxID=13715 RepID=A0A834ZSK3_TETSI|nr:hypothetical protein HHK36_001255 [Tetracentron sinense]
MALELPIAPAEVTSELLAAPSSDVPPALIPDAAMPDTLAVDLDVVLIVDDAENEEFAIQVESLSAENMALRSEKNQVIEDSEKLRLENVALMRLKCGVGASWNLEASMAVLVVVLASVWGWYKISETRTKLHEKPESKSSIWDPRHGGYLTESAMDGLHQGVGRPEMDFTKA